MYYQKKRAVFCWEDWKEFDSIAEAARYYNISHQLLWNVLNNNINHKCVKCGKTFYYLEEAAERIEKILALSEES